MKFIFLFLTLITLQMNVLGQNIDDTIPKEYEKAINKNDYKKILETAISAIAQRYKIDYVKEGTIYLQQGQDMQAFNIHNLIAKCMTIQEKEWENTIKHHFQSIFNSIDEQKNINPKDFNTVAKYLSLRIYPKIFIDESKQANDLVLRADIEGTYTMLMLDLPNAFTPVPKEVTKLWDKKESELFELAQKNINQQQIQKISKDIDVDGNMIEINFLGNEDYAASYALDLMNNAPEFVGEWGCVIAIPNKGLVNICKISKEKPIDFVKFIQKTKAIIEQYYTQHQQPISPDFFWYYKGKFTKIMVTEVQGQINVIAPMGLSELMAKKN